MTTTNRRVFLCALFVLAVTGTFVRADVCSAPPLFDTSGPNCAASRQGMQCVCSECLEWDAATGATWYQVRRCDVSGACTIVGDTRWKNRPGTTATRWCVAWDSPFPTAGTTYSYSIRSCTDGPIGSICAAGLSNPVTYNAAPYMCISGGVEVPCGSIVAGMSAGATGGTNDNDGDGNPDLIDGDDDGDGIADVRDNCLFSSNPGQRDTDGDGVGDACDREPTSAGSDDPDRDDDGIADASDLCPSVYDPDQADGDHDRFGDACDNCPQSWNPMQTDFDHNDRGDECDVEDGAIFAVWTQKTQLSWAPEEGFTSWCVYRGDLLELRQSGTYSQAPGANALAARTCGLAAATMSDTLVEAPGSAAFFLVGGRPGAPGTELGADGSGRMRPNPNPCP